MADKNTKQKIMDMLVVMNTAVKNMRLYPAASASVVNSIEKLYEALEDILSTDESVVISESEKCLLIGGDALSQKDHERSQVSSMLDIMLGFGIRSITINEGLEKEELRSFIEVIGRKPDAVKNEGGIQQVIAGNNFLHIYLDQKVYVARDKNQQLMSGINLNDEQMLDFLMKVHPELAADPEKMQEMAGNPEWLLETFQNGLSRLMEKKGELSSMQLSENLINMIVLMDKASGSFSQNDRDKVAFGIGQELAVLDPELSLLISAENLKQLFGGSLLKEIISNAGSINYDDTQSSSVSAAGSSRGSVPNMEKILYQIQMMQLKDKLSSFLNDDSQAFLDIPFLLVLPKIFEQLVEQNEQEAMAMIINRLLEKLMSENPAIRSQAAKALAEIFDPLPPGQKGELLALLTEPLLAWIKMETLSTPAYKKLCNNVKGVMLNFIEGERFIEAIPILDVFKSISTGALEKNEQIREIASEIIRDLASEEHLAFLFNEFNNGESGKQDEAIQLLLALGDVAVNRLLDMLRDNKDSNERVRIMRNIIAIGHSAIPVITERIDVNAPWYYLRNLAYMIGQIGSGKCAEALQPLLCHENSRVRLEALKSLQRTGGEERARILLAALPGADENFKLNIVEALGAAKSVDAVDPLLDMLKNRPLVATTTRADLEEKICTALGAIGSAAALAALAEIAESKSFLRVRVYTEKVKSAAGRALVSIRKKQAETTGTKK